MPNPKNLFRLNNLTKQKATFNWLDTLPGTTRCPLVPARRCWNLVDHVASYASMRLTFSLTMWYKNGRNNQQRSTKWLRHASLEAGELIFDIDLSLSLFVLSAEWCQLKWVWLDAERPLISTIKRPDDHHHNPRPTKTHFQITRPIPRIRKVGETQPRCENWWNNSGLAWFGKTGQNTTKLAISQTKNNSVWKFQTRSLEIQQKLEQYTHTSFSRNSKLTSKVMKQHLPLRSGINSNLLPILVGTETFIKNNVTHHNL